ncbi:MAG TPA: hypothetical protein VKK79_10730, partial [Candidatus Lokiarchaeia archaeon]|nr:hypothetical protein [Candidatus Lokiarchaeia archaeon]
WMTCATAFPRGEVMGYDIQFGTARVVVFGSLCDKFPKVLAQHQQCDIVFLPLAGRNDIALPGFNVANALQPKIVIPTHYDLFFPPISQWTDLTGFEAKIAAEMPGTQIIKPEIGVPQTLEI